MRMAENTILNYVKIEGVNGYQSKELPICQKCQHGDEFHITRDLHTFKCLVKDCKCETK